jgi:hypothetical protein
MATALEKISGQGGFKIISDTASYTGLQVESIVVNADCVFTEFYVNDIDVLTTKRLSGVTIKQGMYLPTDPGYKITRVKLASGSIIKYF